MNDVERILRRIGRLRNECPLQNDAMLEAFLRTAKLTSSEQASLERLCRAPAKIFFPRALCAAALIGLILFLQEAPRPSPVGTAVETRAETALPGLFVDRYPQAGDAATVPDRLDLGVVWPDRDSDLLFASVEASFLLQDARHAYVEENWTLAQGLYALLLETYSKLFVMQSRIPELEAHLRVGEPELFRY